ncbi:SDR family oxidoreductase [Hamadaea tsunoensis]|uniref:SDR family oxidoreductase n=1 Tax=Hamadaea tsunoensis TaxID=53368 RepID=UPI000401F3F2|nr:SDR family oxidoreductase [Hamadaea tsunoensis]
MTGGADHDHVAVVGLGTVLPGASDVDAFWRLLNHPRPVFTEPGDRFPLADFWSADLDAPDRTYSRVAGYIHDDGDDLEVGWLRRAAREALAGVHLTPGHRRAAFLGAWPGGSQATLQTAVAEAVAQTAVPGTRPEDVRSALHRHLPYADPLPADALPARRLRRALTGLIGDDDALVLIDTACASSLNTVDLGVKHLRAGRAEVVLCGGTESLDPSIAVMFAKLRGLSPSGRVRALDADADGTLFSDAATVLVLKTLTRARVDGDTVFGVITGCGSAADGRGKSVAAPNPDGQRRAILRARQAPGIGPSDVDWTIAHATATAAGDRSELATLAATTAGGVVSATKALVGHTGWAAGATSVTHAILGLRHGVIPAQYAFAGLPADVPDAVTVPDHHLAFPERPDRPRTVGVSAFGFGGTNAHVLISDRPGPIRRTGLDVPADDTLVLVGWSAHLPGLADRDAVREWLSGPAEQPPASFGDPYPVPAPLVTRLPGRTARRIDASQLLALDVAYRFAEENGELWNTVTETTGVFAAHSGVPQLMVECALRCYAHRLRSALDGPAAAALASRLAVTDRRLPAVTEDTQPGVLPNVLASRVAQRYDLHGTVMVVDAGADSTLWAADIAGTALAAGELDLALVLAVSATGSAEAAALAGLAPGRVREGAALLALARRSVARREGWPELAELRPTAAIGSAGRDQLLDQALDVIAAVESGRPATIAGAGPATPALKVVAARTETPPEADQPPTPVLTERHVTVLRARPAPASPPDLALAHGGVLLTDASLVEDAVADAAAAAQTLVLSSRPTAEAPVRVLPDTDLPATVRRTVADRTPHVRIIAAGGPPTAPRLQELAFLIAGAVLTGPATTVPQGQGAAVPDGASAASIGVAIRTPEDGGVTGLFAGLLKAIAVERPGTRTAVLVTDAESEASALRQLEAELAGGGGSVVYRTGAARRVEVFVRAPLPSPGRVPLLPPRPVIVVSGGAGGVATELLVGGLRHETEPAIWLLGSSDLAGERSGTPLGDPAAARSALIQRYVDEGRSLPQAIEAADRALARARSATRLDRLRAVFGTANVRYVMCDVTDPGAVERAAAQVYAEHDRIDLLVHAAGFDRPRALAAKDLAEFCRIRDVKSLGYRHLRASFNHPPPVRWCNIGSLVSAFGEAGEPDYAAGNDVLARVSRSRPDETTIGFPLWRGAGLAGPGTVAGEHLARRRLLTAVDNEEGVEQFRAELHHRGHGPSYYFGDIERQRFSAVYPGAIEPAPAAFLRTRPRADGDWTVWECPLDGVCDAYLNDHLVGGRATVPGTFMLEMAAEAALALLPATAVRGFRDSAFDRFIRPFSGSFPMTLLIAARPGPVGADGNRNVAVRISSTSPALGAYRPPVEHFSTVVIVAAPARPESMESRVDVPVPRGPAVADPYYQDGAGIRLTGFFHNTGSARADGGTGYSVWKPAPGSVDDLAGWAIPALLVCATVRTAALVEDQPGGRGTYAPRRIGRIDLTGLGGDRDWAARCPAGIALTGTPAEDRYRAVTPDGTTVLAVSEVGLVRVDP